MQVSSLGFSGSKPDFELTVLDLNSNLYGRRENFTFRQEKGRQDWKVPETACEREHEAESRFDFSVSVTGSISTGVRHGGRAIAP